MSAPGDHRAGLEHARAIFAAGSTSVHGRDAPASRIPRRAARTSWLSGHTRPRVEFVNAAIGRLLIPRPPPCLPQRDRGRSGLNYLSYVVPAAWGEEADALAKEEPALLALD